MAYEELILPEMRNQNPVLVRYWHLAFLLRQPDRYLTFHRKPDRKTLLQLKTFAQNC